MKVLLNGSETNYQPVTPITWGKFFSDLHDIHVETNHGIVRILLDKKESLSAIKKNPDQPVPGNIKKIEIFTKDTLLITKEGFINVFTLTDSIRCEIPTVSHYFRTDQGERASAIIKKILVTIKPMIDFVNSVGINFLLNFDDILTDQGISLRKEFESFLKSFSKLATLHKKNDNLKFADYLEGPFLQDISIWNKAVKKLFREITDRSKI